MTQIEDFSQQTQDMVDSIIDRPFSDAIPTLERWFDGMSRNQLVFFEQYWLANSPTPSPARAVWEAMRGMRGRIPKAKKPASKYKREVVHVFGHKVVVWRDPVTGRFVRRRRRRR